MIRVYKRNFTRYVGLQNQLSTISSTLDMHTHRTSGIHADIGRHVESSRYDVRTAVATGMDKLNAFSAKVETAETTVNAIFDENRTATFNSATPEVASAVAAGVTLRGGSTVDGSLEKGFKDLVGLAPEELNVLKEIYDATLLLEGDFKESIKSVIDTQFNNAKTGLLGAVDEAADSINELAVVIDGVEAEAINSAASELANVEFVINKVIMRYDANIKEAGFYSGDETPAIGAKLLSQVGAKTMADVYTKAAVHHDISIGTDANGVFDLTTLKNNANITLQDFMNFGRASLFEATHIVQYFIANATETVDGEVVAIPNKFVLTNDDGTALVNKDVRVEFLAR